MAKPDGMQTNRREVHMQIIQVCGNYRPGGVTERLLDAALEGGPRGWPLRWTC